MVQLSAKLDNPSGQTLSYVSEQLARIKIDIAPDGTVTISLMDDSEKNEVYLSLASLSSGLPVKQ